MTSRFFVPAEFLCKCGRPECEAPREPVQTLVDRLDLLRERVGHPLVVSSGLRCAVWNAHEHGEPDSGHLDGTECDLSLTGPGPASLVRSQMLDAIFQDRPRLFPRIGLGATFLHVGVSLRLPSPRIWTYYPGTKRSEAP